MDINPNITGRDAMLVQHALVIAIPFNLLHNVDCSNTYEQMQILKTSGKIMPMRNGNIKDQVLRIVGELKVGKTSPENWKNRTGEDGFLEKIIEEYLENIERYLPQSWVVEWERMK